MATRFSEVSGSIEEFINSVCMVAVLCLVLPLIISNKCINYKDFIRSAENQTNYEKRGNTINEKIIFLNGGNIWIL